MSFSFNLSKLILKSPAIIVSLLLFSNDDMFCVNSSIMRLICHYTLLEIDIYFQWLKS